MDCLKKCYSHNHKEINDLEASKVSEKKFKISFNEYIIDKPAQHSGINQAINWLPLEITQNEIIKMIKGGQSYSAHFKNNYSRVLRRYWSIHLLEYFHIHASTARFASGTTSTAMIG